MPQQFYIKAIQQAVVIEDLPFASGGEGALFAIISPVRFKNCVAKIFHPNKRDAQKEAKINYLQQHPPLFETSAQEQPIVWVKHLLSDSQGDFVGFIMPKATGEKLEILTAPKLPKHLGKEWRRFRLGTNEALRLRLKVCYNLAVALRTIHATGKYVLVDLKPDNILIKSNGVVSIVDIDSIEVIEGGKTLFPATVATPEYTPNEYYTGVQPGKVIMETSWDNFSLAVIYYRLLFGVHPYAATTKAPYDNVNALGDKIKHGLFVHNPSLSNQFVVVPPPHQNFTTIDRQLQGLFLQAFVEGNQNPKARPSAEDWGQALYNTPLLLTNRSLPSRSLQLDKMEDNNWYHLALEKAIQEQGIPVSNSNEKGVVNYLPTAYTTDAVLQEAKTYYKKIAKSIWNIVRYAGMVLGSILVLLLFITMVTGAPFDDIWFVLEVVGNVLFFLPSVFMELGGLNLFFLLLISPFIVASFRQASGMAKDRTQAVRKKMIGTFSFTEAQKQKSLEELQYTLYNQRAKVKQRLREIKNELIVWSQIKSTKEKEFFHKNNRKIAESNREISSQIREEKRAMQAEDDKAKALMIAEAKELKALRLSFQQKLSEHPIYGRIKGQTIAQKIAFLNNGQLPSLSNFDVQVTLKELKALDKNVKEQLQNIKHSYDVKHNALLENANQYKIKIDDLVNGSVDVMRQKTAIDAQLMNEGFKKLLKSIGNLKQEINHKEAELEEINQNIKSLKDELKNYQ